MGCSGSPTRLAVEIVQYVPELFISFSGFEPGGEKREGEDQVMMDQPFTGVCFAAGLHSLRVGDQEGVEEPSDELRLGQTLLDFQRLPNPRRRSP